MSNHIVESYPRVGMRLGICERPPKPPNWPSAMMRLKQHIWIIQIVGDVEKLIGDLLCARELPPSGVKQPQPCKRRPRSTELKLSR